MKKATQNEKVLEMLKNGRRLTQEQVRDEEDIRRLAARIKQLRNEGHDIKSVRKPVTDSKGVTRLIAEYHL